MGFDVIRANPQCRLIFRNRLGEPAGHGR
jgi:hypothetical protein